LGRKAPLKAFLAQYFPMSFFHRPKLGFSIHEESLQDISQLGVKALDRARSTGFLDVKSDAAYGEFDRDMIYLGATCFSYDVWKSVFLPQDGPTPAARDVA
jgi:asparagine synthase (glutamine-hydrolysing)